MKTKANDTLKESVNNFFVSAQDSGLELRQGQLDMAMEICEAIEDRKSLAVEAEVGIGKSYAYLVPAIYNYLNEHKQVIIATSTIALQEQLSTDVKKVLEMIGTKIPVFIAKGIKNYACETRLRKVMVKNKSVVLKEVLQSVKSGEADRSKLGLNVPEDLWQQICGVSYTDMCMSCKKSRSCPYCKLRYHLRRSGGIVICNQNLLAAHMINTENRTPGIFNTHRGLYIIDEAHNIESKIRDAYTVSYSRDDLIHLLLNCIDMTPYKRKSEVKPYALDTIDDVELLFKLLVRQVKEQSKALDADTSVYRLEQNPITDGLLRKVLKRIVHLDERSTVILQDGIDFLNKVLNTEKYIVWLEMDGKLKICVCKKEIRRKISSMLFPYRNTTILTSATISDKNYGTARDKCGYYLNSIGYPIIGNVSEPKPSPFNYAKNTMLYCSDALCYPSLENREEYRRQSIDEIVKLLDVTKGKSLILFTSKEDMDYVYRKLSNMHLPCKILIQNKTSSQAHQLEKFRTDTNSVLLGTGTYWEGINIEGESLSQVIIFKLPFPVPDPIIEYKMSMAKDKIRDVAVPEMIIKLKQGAGRLIRSSSDKGIVSIIDPRAGRKLCNFYRATILDTLCEKNETNDISVLKEFWNRICEEKL